MGEDRECPVNKDERIRSRTKETRQGREDGRRGIDLEYGEQEARKRGEDDRQNCARARVGAHVHEWKGREVHAGAFIASARTCAMSSSAG